MEGKSKAVPKLGGWSVPMNKKPQLPWFVRDDVKLPMEEAWSFPMMTADIIIEKMRADDKPIPMKAMPAPSAVTAETIIAKNQTAYKPVARKVRSVPGVMPEEARVIRQIPEDPLLTLPILPVHPPEFEPIPKISKEDMVRHLNNSDGFLWPEEEKLFAHVLRLNHRALARVPEERGTLRDDYFSPYIIPTIEHVPWQERNIPIPRGLHDTLVEMIKSKIAAGVYEPSQASYRSKWFWVPKPRSDQLRIVHDLQKLNGVTIRDAGLPPNLDELVEPFAGRACYTVLDLFSGYDARKLALESRDLTSFFTPLGLFRLTSLPVGFTNGVQEFQTCITFILADEIPVVVAVFIDDLPIKGPSSRYMIGDTYETIPENSGIRRFIWEHALDVHRVLHRLGCAGATITLKKLVLCRPEAVIVGQRCTLEGRLPDKSKISKIKNWPRLRTPKDVRSFLGLCGTVRIWIINYSLVSLPLRELTRKEVLFVWDIRRQEAMDMLKELITSAPVLCSIDYTLGTAIRLGVDTSYIAIGFILWQDDLQGRRRLARYGSLPLNDRESRYSQPKLELYGLFRALKHWRIYIIYVKPLIVEMDAKFVRDMLNNPDMQPNAAINRWIQNILLFDITLVHVPGSNHLGPDALSRRPFTEGDSDIEDEEENLWFSTKVHLSQKVGLDWSGRRDPSRPGNFNSKDGRRDFTIGGMMFHRQGNAFKASPRLLDEDALHHVVKFLDTLEWPSHITSETARKRFLEKIRRFHLDGNKLWKKRLRKEPVEVILDPDRRKEVMTQAHEDLGHRGVFGTTKTLIERFWWPGIFDDIWWHVRSCHECQIRSTKKVEIPITISEPARIFVKVYVDVMLMPKAQGFRYIVAARDDLTGATEGRALRKASAHNLAKFFWEEIICRYGGIGSVVTDNGPELKGAFEEMMRRYGIPHIHISPYNSKANGVVERSHFITREALVKSCEGNINKWPEKVAHVFFADRVTTRRATGFSPYYLLYGVDPVLPFDLTEATYLVPGFQRGLTTVELLALRVRQLEKKEDDMDRAAETIRKSRMHSKEAFERRFHNRLTKREYKEGDLVLVRNKAIEEDLDRKHKPRYLGPFEVVRRTKGGSYVVKELDGSISRRGIAASRLLPYYVRDGQPISPDELPWTESNEVMDVDGDDSDRELSGDEA